MTDLNPGAAYPRPGTNDARIIFLAGAVRHWWDANWGSDEHREYMKWRNEVRVALIAGGYLTYAHYEAFKGTWNPRAQRVNDAAIRESDLMLILTDESIPSVGTDEEIVVAEDAGVPILRLPDSVGIARVLPMVREALNPLSPDPPPPFPYKEEARDRLIVLREVHDSFTQEGHDPICVCGDTYSDHATRNGHCPTRVGRFECS